ncbi:MAG: hypothetical protein LBB18_00240 [Puniceicoccales bacterium]|jgi:hypothetical protein|nr:hypothetical protein [Puniceicoccales bacterium]
MFTALVKFCDFVDRVMIKCLVEGVFVGMFSLPAMFAACIDGICTYCSHNAKFLKRKRHDTITE